MSSPASLDVAFPPKLIQPLFEGKYSYRVFMGGRGSGKSWGISRALLILAYQKSLRILCTRETQKRIEDSVHRLLCDQITLLNLTSFYEITANQIRGKNGSLFLFSGLSDQTADGLKSLEGVDRVWVEEAQSVTEGSWRILIPTIRKEDSETWISFNPQLESDATYQRFVAKPHPSSIITEINYWENPFFTGKQESDRLHDKESMREDDYSHIWEGKCRPAVEGAIFFNEISQAQKGNRLKNVPHDGNLKTHLVWDLGFSDSMSISLVQKVSGEVRVIHYIEGNQRTLADYNAELRALRLDDQPMNWGTCYLPHDGFAARHQTGKMDSEIMQGLGWTVLAIPNIGIDSGINRAREVFPRVYFHQERAARLIECLKRYRWNISEKTGQAITPLHDEFSHGGDCFRYLALVESQMSNDSYGGVLNYPRLFNA